MANWSDPRILADHAEASAGTAIDAGLRSYMMKVYMLMAGGVLVTGLVAWAVANSPATLGLFYNLETGGMTGLGWIAMLSPLAFVLVLSFGINRLSASAAQTLFWVFAAVMGISMAAIFLRFTGPSIATTFFATSTAFLGLSLYGYTTRKDLSGFGTFLFMGVIGLLVLMLINLFMQSSMMAMVISGLGVLIFAGLTAYDTQKIKSMYYYVQGSEMLGKTTVMGALTLYLDFVNMFQFLLSFMGSSND